MADMNLARAHEIVAAINARSLVTIGIDQPLGSLSGVTLQEMIEAKAAVERENNAAVEAAKAKGGGYSINLVPDDRLIAAVYTLHHYTPRHDAILCVPVDHFLGDRLALAVVVIDSAEADADDDEGVAHG
ncbi:hypothetical protein J2X65_003199 [Ancylobacter sp. 3268]|uniref:hypothetical protein n=1 Tax=Ancylobacter sp. 3268 TaxID=2817752 RepID=UPI00286213BB|nr:hypothetical protein [Ancylobacter sp. 3268]MDR6953836.1 hypothetical protein [Ancylobacter sp. 3268]